MAHYLWNEVRRGYISQLRSQLLSIQKAEGKLKQARTSRFPDMFISHLKLNLELEQESLLTLCTIIQMYYQEIRQLDEFKALPVWSEIEETEFSHETETPWKR
jgi:hypothetical protein